MNPHLLRQLWALVEQSQSHRILSLDDNSLVHWLIDQVSGERSLDTVETANLNCYIRSRIPLIRDIAQS
ncbi:hypothetical protein [Leptolyngbya iicbica]|uniref:Uncharacterized protein n=2 Tax=Cyanophyceae TaxID=3028117 RepID=A0A4Q7E522_9CYAN|nr:hypothetical protein [Leptolyngbya sp. LK]RZM77970.1 hypothetical protein DYY88_15605 [Leptolyngbya sp. LK]